VLDYLVLVLSVALAGFFSGSETGFYSLNRIRLRFRLEHGWPGAAQLRKLTDEPELAISTMLVGTNIMVYLATVVCARRLGEMGLGGRADLYSSLIMPPVLLIFAEIIPKSLYRCRADTLMYKTAGLLGACKAVFFPLLVLLRELVRVLKSFARGGGFERGDVFTTEKLRFVLSEGTALGVLSSYQQAMANNVLRVKSLNVRRAMVPLERVVMVPDAASLGELYEALRQHRFSRIPVYSERRDNIVGVINVIDVMSAQGRAPVQALTRHCPLLDARLSVAEALYTLQRARQQMAVIVERDGGARGIVTVKDLVEEIVGELRAW